MDRETRHETRTDVTEETGERPTVAVFRPADERLEQARTHLDSLGVDPLADPMLEIVPTGELPREDAEYTILTSKTGVDLVSGTDWRPAGTLCAIGEATAAELREAGYAVDIVPETYTSSGLVERLESEVDGQRVEIARSDHGSPVLLDGLEAAGGYLHETILYRLVRPEGAGVSTEYAARGDLTGALFSSSLTVENFVAAAEERGLREAALAGLDEAVVGVIGEPTGETATALGIEVDVIPDQATFDALAETAVARLNISEE